MADPSHNELDERPIFITGVYRSGTTLIAQMINAHSELNVIHDTVNYFRFYWDRYEPIGERYPDVIEELTDRLGRRWSITVPRKRILERLRGQDIVEHRQLFTTVMRETFCADKPEVRWGEKSLLEWTRIPAFLAMFPEGRTIHVMRDPRDVLASYREYTIEPPHRYLDTVFACLHSMDWAATEGRRMPREAHLLLRHEDLVTDPSAMLEGLCRFLSVEVEPQMLDTQIFKVRAGERRWDPNTAFGDVAPEDGIVAHTANRWRTKLDEWETVLVESVIGSLMEEFGYPLSGVEIDSQGLAEVWERFKTTPLLQTRLCDWLTTGQGVESYPSDPTDPSTWEKTAATG